MASYILMAAFEEDESSIYEFYIGGYVTKEDAEKRMNELMVLEEPFSTNDNEFLVTRTQKIRDFEYLSTNLETELEFNETDIETGVCEFVKYSDMDYTIIECSDKPVFGRWITY